MRSPSPSPPAKRIKLKSADEDGSKVAPIDVDDAMAAVEAPVLDDDEPDHCTICLQSIRDRTVLPTCSHEFCFECIVIWTEQSRRCPLCSRAVGPHLVHHIRSRTDFQRYFLPPLRTSPPPAPLLPRTTLRAPPRARTRADRDRDRREVENAHARDEVDALDRAIDRRKWVYAHGLYAKHVATNAHTRYRPFPTPAQFAASSDLVKRATIWTRRELHVWPTLEIEFLVTFVTSLMKSLDIRSEGAVKLLAEFLDMDTGLRTNAEHFAHELYSYLRSPYRDLTVYDSVVQYDVPSNLEPPPKRAPARPHWRPSPPHRSQHDRDGRSDHRAYHDSYAAAGPSRARDDPDSPYQSPRAASSSRSRSRERAPAFVSRQSFRAGRRGEGRATSRRDSREARSHSRSRSPSRSRSKSRSRDRRHHASGRKREREEGGGTGKHKAATRPHAGGGRRSSSPLGDAEMRDEEEYGPSAPPKGEHASPMRDLPTSEHPPTAHPAPSETPAQHDLALASASAPPPGLKIRGQAAARHTNPPPAPIADPPAPTVTAAPTPLRTERIPRNWSLRDSVQAHLRPAPGGHRRRTDAPSDPTAAPPPPPTTAADPEPALLARLSDAPPLDSCPASPPLSASPATPGTPAPAEAPGGSAARSGRSAPEIMAHTRKRLARLRGAVVAGVAPDTPGEEAVPSVLIEGGREKRGDGAPSVLEGGRAKRGDGTAPGEGCFEDPNAAEGNEEAGRSIGGPARSGLHERLEAERAAANARESARLALLARLAKERKLATPAIVLALDGDREERDTPRQRLLDRLADERRRTQEDAAVDGPTLDQSAEEERRGATSEESEVRLRTQAQLRVRLARAKREAATEDATGPAGAARDSKKQQVARVAEISKEEALKAKLRARETTVR